MTTAIFAPTNDAFTKLPAGTMNYLLRSENYDLLVNILQHHVLDGRYYMGIGLDDTTVRLPTMLNETYVDVTIDTDYAVTNVNGSGLATVAYFVKSTSTSSDALLSQAVENAELQNQASSALGEAADALAEEEQVSFVYIHNDANGVCGWTTAVY